MPKAPIVAIATVIASAFGGCAITPTPLADTEISSLAESSAGRVTADQEPLSGPVDLYEAMARALKYNLDRRVEEMGAALRVKELDLAHYAMLPNLVAGSGYAARDKDNASNSLNILTGTQSLPFSTSQDRRMQTADVAFSWNVLDFGLSYVRARQAADKYLIAKELRRKIVARIVEDVRTAYWRVLSSDRLIQKLTELETRVRRAQANSHLVSQDRQTSPITAATYDRELVEIKRAILELQRDLSLARTQLAALMNIKPGTPFKVVAPASAIPKLTMSVNEMISTALHNRAELKEVWYQRRINEQEINAAFLEMLPGITPYAGTNYDSNEFLYNSNWLNWGAKVSWNLLKIVQYPAKREVIEAQDQQIDARGLAVTMAVMTQVHVSRIRFLHSTKELQTANEYLKVQQGLVSLMRAEAAADRISEHTMVREEMNTLVAEAKRDIAQAALQSAFAGVYSSIGLDLYADELPATLDVKSLAGKLRGIWAQRGDAPGRRKV